MTTVGYGDFYPRFVSTMTFTYIYISIGVPMVLLVVCALASSFAHHGYRLLCFLVVTTERAAIKHSTVAKELSNRITTRVEQRRARHRKLRELQFDADDFDDTAKGLVSPSR